MKTDGNVEESTRARNHQSERRPTHLTSIGISKKAGRKSVNWRDDISAVEDVIIGYSVGCIYVAHEMRTMTTRFTWFCWPLNGCRFASDDMMENVGAIMNFAQNRKGKYQTKPLGR
jgi:hypothetical protein